MIGEASESDKVARVMRMRPRLRADVDLVELGNGRMLAVSGTRFLALETTHMRVLASLLDGEHRMTEIWRSTNGVMTPALVVRTVMMLEAVGFIADGPAVSVGAEGAFLDSIGVDSPIGGVVVMMLGLAEQATKLCEAALDQICREWRRVELKSLGLAEGGESPLLVITPDYLAEELAEVNQVMLELDREWALVKPFTDEIWIGPVFGREEGAACWTCLSQRLKGHRILEKYAELETGRRTPVGILQSGVATSITLALSAALLRLVAGSSSDLLSIELPELVTQRHVVTKRPQCPACGDVRVDPIGFELVSRPRGRDDSGRPLKRVKSLSETRESLERHISPYSGVITKLTPIDSDSDLYFSAAAGHDFAPSRTDFSLLVKTLRGSLSGGKGRTPLQAEVSALCEAVERGLTMYTGDEPVITATYREVADSAIEPSLLLGFSDHQYLNRIALNESNPSKYAFVPNRIDPDAVIDWCWVKDVGGGPNRLVPASYCYYGHPDLYSKCYCLADSNGSAAGGVLEEAIVSGFSELIERDSVGIWWYNRIRCPGLDLDSIDDSYLIALRQEHKRMGREVWALDLTTDSSVPCFALLSARLDDSPEDIIVSFGCDLDPKLALDAALDELNQFLPWVSKDENDVTRYRGVEPEAVDWFQNATVSSEPYLLPSETLPFTRLDQIYGLRTDDCLKDIQVCKDIAENLGSRMYAMDVSRPEVDVAVARVIVPGLCHFWRRLGPRRLYEVPVAMGYLAKPHSENELNPRTVYF